jgi:hypothetical protein
MLPAPVLEKAQAELREWHSTGVSVMEMSHRGKDFIGIAGKAEADLRELLAVPGDYKVSIRLTPEKKDSLLQYAIQDDRTFSSLISKILGNWLRDQKKQDEWR